MTAPARAAISWSGGKDGCLALLRAREAGLDVTTFVTFFEPSGPSKSHALPHELIAAQVGALGGAAWPIDAPVPNATSPSYADVFDDTLVRLHRTGHTHVVFGDIDLLAHRQWLEPRCAAAGLVASFPLWGLARRAVAAEVIARGIHARVVCVDTRWLDASFCGVDYDEAFLARLPPGVCACGEEGEFHTFVRDAPGFAAPLRIKHGTRRVVASTPPFAATEYVFETPVLPDREHS